MDFSAYPVTYILMAINILFFFLAGSGSDLQNKMIMWPYGVKRNGQYYRFISSGFLHADFMHLFFNMFTLYFFGRNIEHIFHEIFANGTVWYVVLYFTALIISDLPSYFKHNDDNNYRSLGASGAVSAIVFAAVLFNPWAQFRLYGFIAMSATVFAVVYIAYCIYMGKKQGDNVNHDAHLWGSLYGLAATFILVAALRPDIFPAIIEELKHPSLFGR